ncbi:hypothetical protein ACIBO1_20030 [Micromonospora sp. NPDC049903]|uniref:hypothetical protein n=1 Tax=Micromonospora sp. NPDC049903 TaxID=3364276 RepID=UPI00379429BC
MRYRTESQDADGEGELSPAHFSGLAVLSYGLLRAPAEPVEATITGGVVVQTETVGPLLVSLDGAALHFSVGRECLDIVWAALDGVAEQAETADDRAVNRHQHIEYLPGDGYRAPEYIPLVIVADWPEAGNTLVSAQARAQRHERIPDVRPEA